MSFGSWEIFTRREVGGALEWSSLILTSIDKAKCGERRFRGSASGRHRPWAVEFPRSDFGAAANLKRVTGHPARCVLCEETDDVSHVVRLTDPLQRLYSQDVVPALVGSHETRHLGIQQP